MAALDHTAANHLKLMEDKFVVFSNAITDVTGVNSTLEELIANDTALVNSFGDPDREPIVEFHALNFKQEVRSAIISSRRVMHAVKSIARYASNSAHIQRIEEELNSHHQDTSKCQKLRGYLTVISARISNCRKRVENIQPMYEKVYGEVLQRIDHSASLVEPSVTTTFKSILRLFGSISVCTIGVIALALLYPLLQKYLTLSDSNESQKPADNITISEAVVHGAAHPDGKKSASLTGFILGCVICLACCVLLALGCFLIYRRAFRAHQQPEQVEESSSRSMYHPPTSMTVSFQSAGVEISTFLTKMEHFKSELLYLEQSLEKAIKCENSGRIREIEEQLRKLHVNMEAILTATRI